MTAEIPEGTGQENIRRVLMPPKDRLIPNLRDAGLMGVLQQTDIFYETFAGYIGGRICSRCNL